MSAFETTTLAEIASLAAYKGCDSTRVSVTQYGPKGIFIDVRLFRTGLPTAHGLRFRLDQMPVLMRALHEAHAKGLHFAKDIERGAA